MQRKYQSGIPWILSLSFLTPLIAHAYVGSFSRLMADDFCSASVVRTRGVLRASLYWYMTWTGRYSANFLDSLAGLLGPYASPILPAVILLLWGCALGVVFYQLKLTGKSPARFLLAALLAGLVLFTTLSSAPAVSQSLYWGQGMRSLVPPLILLIVYMGFLLVYWKSGQAPFHPSISVGISFGVAFIAAGFSETAAVLQISLLFLLLLSGCFSEGPGFRKNMLPLLAAGLLASALALGVILLAPGNAAREDFYPRHPGSLELVKITLLSALKFLRQAVGLGSPFDLWSFIHRFLNLSAVMILLGLVGLGFFESQASQSGRESPRPQLLFWIPLAAALLLVISFIPAAYALSAGPPNRTKIIPDFVLVLSLAAWGYVLGTVLRGRESGRGSRSRAGFLPYALVGICAIFALNALWDAYLVSQTAPAFISYATAWDQNHEKILDRKAAGRRHVVVQPLRNPAGLDEIGPDSRFWVNKCVGSYYGVRVSTFPGGVQYLPIKSFVPLVGSFESFVFK